ncbi:hydroxymethylglutaryl-CoA lyase [Puniceibacterium sp. IMCC21224]|uniref:hydroxymethylglutaryl-CoA lyase n=1 Tax=Puniceibacterium sp. IMCC21224 TaxID=1618204 RepID=UPI00064DF6FF|nr:hydroxymethylglutaryl-CoA lyase [Puniceibacterium sp. IMCC21224]KMK68529.1 HMGL-like protein [Puniceibacterium sp. IMCC21224]
MTDHVRVYEVGPRDGLQNEKALIPTKDKIALINLLSRAGFEKIEATSFVSPKWVPQLADAAEVMAGIDRRDGTDYSVLTPNLRGFEAALASGANEVAVFASASEAFSQKNINCSITESLQRFAPVMEAAHQAGLRVRGYVSCAVDCPYSGMVDPAAVARVAGALSDMGCYEIVPSDTIGRATPEAVQRMLAVVLADIPAARLACHFHDTGGQALANVAVAVDLGVRTFDSAVGGLGGCPYAPGAKGNLSTTALVTMLEQRGFHTGIDQVLLAKAEALVASLAPQNTTTGPQHDV